VSLGVHGTCAIANTDRAYCWGYNGYGEMGDGTTSQRNSPVAVIGGKRWLKVLTGDLMSCGLDTSRRVWCWGHNSYGQLGDGTTTARTVPTLVYGDETTIDFAIGSYGLLRLVQ